MAISSISFRGTDDYPEIPEWVNRPYETRRQQMLAQMQTEQDNPINDELKTTRIKTSPKRDVFISTKGKRVEKKEHRGLKITALFTAAAVAATIYAGACAINRNSNSNTDDTTQPSISEPYSSETDDTSADNGIDVQDKNPEMQRAVTSDDEDMEPNETPFSDVAAENNEKETMVESNDEKSLDEPSENSLINDEFKGSGQALLDELKTLNGEAPKYYDKLCNALNMNKNDTADYLTQLCQSEKCANGCIEPSLFYAQIFRESGFDPDVIGDNGAAIGLSQFHKCAVDEVNRQFDTNYTYQDRYDPIKSLEMMSLLLNYDYETTKSTYGMLAMYNQGHPALDEPDGIAYVQNVLAQIGLTM